MLACLKLLAAFCCGGANLQNGQFMSQVRQMLHFARRGFSRVRREFSVWAEGRHIFGRRPRPRASKRCSRLPVVSIQVYSVELKEKRIPTQNVFLFKPYTNEVKESFVQFHRLCSSRNDRFPCSWAILFGKLISGKCGDLPGSHLQQNDIT